MSAKGAPHDIDLDPENLKFRLICILPKDFSDFKDVARVLGKLKKLNIIESRVRTYNKPDKLRRGCFVLHGCYDGKFILNIEVKKFRRIQIPRYHGRQLLTALHCRIITLMRLSLSLWRKFWRLRYSSGGRSSIIVFLS